MDRGDCPVAIRDRPHVLVVAGSDSSGGAGIARDVATLSRFGVAASLAVTAVTAQTHSAVMAIEAMPAPLVAMQMRAALAADQIAAVKIGVLATAEIVEAVADVLKAHHGVPVVLDPVLASSSGRRLLSDEGIDCLRRHLLPASLLVTPNIPELGILAGDRDASSDAHIADQAGRLLECGAANLLVKGGHALGSRAIDTLYSRETSARPYESARRDVELRGTGCMLSSAIAAGLALGLDVGAAIASAKDFIGEMFDAEGEGQSDTQRNGG